MLSTASIKSAASSASNTTDGGTRSHAVANALKICHARVTRPGAPCGGAENLPVEVMRPTPGASV